MGTSTKWQLSDEAARRYDEVLVPHILGPAAEVLVAQMEIRPGDRVLDVGCGTGAAMRSAVRSTGMDGCVHGVDVNAAMLERARATLRDAPAPVELSESDALKLPAADDSYHVALCAQTLQFLSDRRRAVSEMRRVLEPGGRVGISTWSRIEDSPYFHSLGSAMTDYLGPETSAGLAAAFTLSSPDELNALLVGAGFTETFVEEIDFELQLPDLVDFVPRHVSATPMAAAFERVPDPVREAVIGRVVTDLVGYAANGTVRLPFRTLVGLGVKRAG